MSDPRTFGQAVREARLAKGMSMGQLATAVHRSTASVRRWERDEGVPAASVRGDVADALGLSPDDLALIDDEPGTEPPPPVHVTPPPVHVTPPPVHVTPPPVHVTPPPVHVTPPPVHVTPPPVHVTPPPVHVTPPPPADATPPRPIRTAPPPPAPRASAQASSQATQAAASRVTGIAPVVDPGPTGVKGWFAVLYDPDKPWLGYVRAALTVIVLIVLAWLLIWALGGLLDTLGEFWESMWAESP